MKQKFVFLFIVLTLLVNGQSSITSERNYFRIGDRITKQQVEYKDPGPFGQKITWDFSMLTTLNDKYKINYFSRTRGDTTRMVAHEHDTRYRYLLKNDTLWLTDYQNRTTRMVFDQPEAQLVYPFRYGDFVNSYFSGKGMYSETVDLEAAGTTYVIVDATGELITPTKKKLENVLRVRKVRDYTEIGIDSVSLRLESYSWYALGYRYPVFETYKSYIIQSDTTLENFSTSFYYPIEELYELAPDPANEAVLDTQPEDINTVFTEASYQPNPVENVLTINYKLTRPAQIWFSVHNNIGISVCQTGNQHLSEGYNSTAINMGHLITGTYTLYVHVDDMVMNMTIIKK